MTCSTLKVHTLLLIMSVFQQAISCPSYCKCIFTNYLYQVSCSGQRLISVEQEVPKSVQWLDLSNNYISELRNYEFQDLGMVEIIKLNLNKNGINSIALNALNGLLKIKFIDLSNNHLHKINPSTFENNPNLNHLILNGNPLKIFPNDERFIISKSLKRLEISHCGISYFTSEMFKSLTSLQYLNISNNNNILQIKEFILETLSSLVELDIGNTAIPCDTSSAIVKWAKTNQAKIIGSQCQQLNNTEIFLKDSNNNQPKKFEKMIMQSDPFDEEYFNDMQSEEDYSSDSTGDHIYNCSCVCPNEKLNDNMNIKTDIGSSSSDIKMETISHNEYLTTIWLAFINGIIIGAAISISFILFWIYCLKYINRSHRRRIQRVAQYEGLSNGRETPPPPYSVLFS